MVYKGLKGKVQAHMVPGNRERTLVQRRICGAVS